MKRFVFLLFLFAALYQQQLTAKIIRSEFFASDAFPIVSPEGNAALLYDVADAPVVSTVAQMLNGDIQAVTGSTITIQTENNSQPYLIVAGTVGSSKYIRGLSDAGKIDMSSLVGKWESYRLQIVNNPYPGVQKALVVCGSTPRGTAYGLLEISRLLGVSPYIWWADVRPEQRSSVYLSGDMMEVGEPSVKYRGIFINDEDWGILPWAKNGIDAAYKNIGPNTYQKVAELLLRLRANTLWPAKHGASKAFWSLNENIKIARDYNIVMSSGDPMLRDNLWEWPRFGGTSTNYSYATNKDMMLRYWGARVGQSKGYEAIYDISTRGFQDEPLLGYTSQADAITGISALIADQRKLLQDSIGDATKVPQIYLPYKEALDLYNAGLKIPDDVTLCWVDDNFGYIRQLPTDQEQLRSGGNGVYYHLSYLGTPAPYIWLSSMSPAFLSYELSKAYHHGIQRFWMFNVGDIKPAEQELEFCMDLAWNVDDWQPKDAYQYSRYWASNTFGESFADAIGSIKNEYYALAAACKPELINRMDYSNDECNRRIARYEKLIERVDSLKSSIPSSKQDAFFELIEYPVKGAAEMNIKIIRAKQSWFYAASGIQDSTLTFTTDSRNGYRTIKSMTDQFNQQTAGGKWNLMMDDKPYGGSVFDMPLLPTADDISGLTRTVESPQRTYYPAKDYLIGQGNLTKVENMGVSGSSMMVWPLDIKVYNTATYGSAPYMQYDVKVKAGLNKIVVRCLPSFPVTTSNDLRVGLVVNNQSIVTKSIKTTAMSGKWNTTVAQGFADATVSYVASNDAKIPIKVYFMDPGLAISDIYVESEDVWDNSLTDALLVNPDFEQNASGVHLDGRGIPYGWHMNTLPQGGSYGVNSDVENPHNDYSCWVISKPFPNDFLLYQTIPASKLEPGVYQVSCLLWNQNGISGNCRLFANQNVQYFSSPDGVDNILTDGEINSYASYQGTTTSDATMKPMSVYVTIHEGDSLQLGIRTSNKKNDGTVATGNDPLGWFKADHFRIRKVAGLSDIKMRNDTLAQKLISNYDFEYRSDGKLNVAPNTGRGVPSGWNINGEFPGLSYGVNQAAVNLHGANVCWFQNQLGQPMPSKFELYQIIPSTKLIPGRYKVSCKLYVQDGLLGNCRMFANKNVQYFGAPTDYLNNLTAGESNTFAGYVGGDVNNYVLQDMFVYVDVAEGEDLKIGIRSGNQMGDGTYATGGNTTGWFKVDYFTIERMPVTTNIINIDVSKPRLVKGIYNLMGQQVSTQTGVIHSLPKGIYIVDGKKMIVK